MANGISSWHADVPSWAKTLAFLGGTIGVPALVTAFLLLQSAGVIRSPARDNGERLDHLTTVVEKNIEERNKDSSRVVNAIRILCQTAAQNVRDQNSCGNIQ